MIPANRQIHAKLEIIRPSGRVDVTPYLESAEVELGSIEDLGTGTGADIGVRTLTFSLRNDGQRVQYWDTDTLLGDSEKVLGDTEDGVDLTAIIGAGKWARRSFAPRDKQSDWNVVAGEWEPLLWPYRGVVFQVAVTAPGMAPNNWITLFEGYLGDSITTEPHRVTVRCRDKSKRLQDAYIDTPKTYTGPMAAETLIQAIINDYVENPPQLYCPVASGITFDKMVVEYCSVWDAIQNVAKQIGWFLGYRWNGSEYALTFMEPPRDKTTADFELNWEDDIYHESLEISDADIRNVVTVTYRDKATGERKTVTVINDESIAEYGRRAMQIEEADTSLIDTEEKALNFANKCLWDLSELSATDKLDVPLLPELDLFSTLLITNPLTSSTTDFYAVQTVRHTLDFGERASFRTEIIATGRVVGARKRWTNMETRPGRPGQPIDPDRIPPGELPPDRLPDYSLGVEKFMENLKPPIMVTSLPVLPDPRFPKDTIVFLTTDQKLYATDGDTWSPMVATDFSELDGELQSNQIALGAITEELIAANAITKTKIADGSIETPKLAAGAVTAEKIAANAVTADKINAGAITAEKIATDAVTTNKIAAGAITTEKLAAHAVTADMVTAAIIEAGGIKADWYADIRNVLPYTGQDSLDADNPIVIPFYIPSETTKIVAAFLSAEARRYRAYAKSAPYTERLWWNKRTGNVATFGETPVTVTLQTTSASGTTGNQTLRHRHYEPGSSINIMTGNVKDEELGMTNLGHSHSFNYTRASGVQLNNFNDHKHELDPSHAHDLEFGIHEDTTPANVRMRIHNGTSWSSYITLAPAPSGNDAYDLISGANVPKHNNNASEMDLTPYLSGTGWKYIEFTSSRLGRIHWNLILKVDITA